MEKVLERDVVERKELLRIFSSLLSVLKMEKFQINFGAELAIEYKDYKRDLEKHIKQLQKKHCPIVIAGETSAGKSSLLNLIIGSNILPKGVLQCTSTICHIYNNVEKKAVVIDENDREICINDVTLETLEKYIVFKKSSPNYKRVNIYWPLPMLKDFALLVDTPGVGVREEMTTKLLDYMQEAVAFIYVINTPTAGGVQKDRLGIILEKQAELENDGFVNHFDPERAIFVCNKWEQIADEGEKEEEVVYNTIAENLETMWPTEEGQDIRKQMYKMSVKTDMKNKENGLGSTKHFKLLLSGIEGLISASLHQQIKQHVGWLQKFLEKVYGNVIAKKNMSNQSQQMKRDIQREVKERLSFLENDAHNVKEKIMKEARQIYRDKASQLVDHLRNKDTQKKIFMWREDELPVGKYLYEIDEKAEPLIVEKINREITKWCETHKVRYATIYLLQECMQQFGKQFDDIDQIMQGRRTPCAKISFPRTTILLSDSDDTFHFEEYKRRLLFSLGPFQIARCISRMISAYFRHLLKNVEERKRAKKEYLNNKTAYMLDLAKERIEMYSVDVIFKCLCDTFLTCFESGLDDCMSVIPAEIEANYKLMENIMNDQRDCETLMQEYMPIEKECKNVRQSLLYFKIKFLSGFRPQILNEKAELGQGSYATVHLCEVDIGGKKLECAVKRQRMFLTSDRYIKLSEADTMRKFKHQNIIQCLGVTVQEKGSHKEFLNIFMEVCDCSLDVVILCNSHPMTICSCNKHRRKTCGMLRQEDHGYQESFENFSNTLDDILNGLIYLHTNGFVHRDLKLSNILIKGGTAKIADIGFTKPINHIQGTIIGTPLYMAPEVLSGDMYEQSADIFSLAIMMWEMWHGRRVFSGSEYSGVITTYNSVKEHVLSGARPKFKANSAPPEEIQIMMKECWNHAAKSRPTALKLKQKLNDIVTAFRNLEIRERPLTDMYSTLYQR